MQLRFSIEDAGHKAARSKGWSGTCPPETRRPHKRLNRATVTNAANPAPSTEATYHAAGSNSLDNGPMEYDAPEVNSRPTEQPPDDSPNTSNQSPFADGPQQSPHIQRPQAAPYLWPPSAPHLLHLPPAVCRQPTAGSAHRIRAGRAPQHLHARKYAGAGGERCIECVIDTPFPRARTQNGWCCRGPPPR